MLINDTELYTVFTLRLAKWLCDAGFRCVKTEPDKRKPWLNVFKFKNTPQLQAAIDEFKSL